jgi:hypothetical protein
MTRVAAQMELAVTAEQCLAAIQYAMEEPRLKAAYRGLRPGKEYAGWVTHVEPGRRLEIVYGGLDPLTNKRNHRFGWRVRYEFAAAGPGRTRVEVAVEYGWLTAIGGAGTTRAQAENDVARRLAELHMLELGMRVAAGDDPTATQEAIGAGPAHVGAPAARAREAAR